MDSQICRVCLNKTASISVFSNHDDNIQLSTKIMRCANVNITEDDDLPKFICVNCVNELLVSYDFVQKCIDSDKTLRCLNGDLFLNLQDSIDLNIKEENMKREVVEQETFDEFDDNENSQIEYFEEKESASEEPKSLSSTKKSFSRKYVRKKRTKVGPIQCIVCGLMVLSPSAMETHMRTHTGEKPYDCFHCGTKFPTKGALKRHTETYHTHRERKFTCETCGNSFFRKNDIITHMRVHTDERPYVCSYCSSRFRQVASLIRHKRTHTGEKNYSCPICDKKFADRNLVNKHQLVHSNERKFTCHLCNKSMKSRTALNVHLSLHSNEKQNICSYCGMALSTKGNLKNHVRRVHSERSGQCSVCLKTFSDLQEHMRKHTGERPYGCKICTQAFATKRSLAHHTLFKHENATKFKCSIGDCTRTFPTAMLLEFHLLKHTNHTPYVCQHCSRGFFRTSDLSRHLRVSHMDVQMKMSIKPEIN